MIQKLGENKKNKACICIITDCYSRIMRRTAVLIFISFILVENSFNIVKKQFISGLLKVSESRYCGQRAVCSCDELLNW